MAVLESQKNNMRHSEIFTGFKKACDELGIEYKENVATEELCFKDRNNSSEGTTFFQGSCEKTTEEKTLLRVESPFQNYKGNSLEEAVSYLKEAHLSFYSTN